MVGGPADPEAWDRWFGHLNALAEGEGEARAREHKASNLPAELAALYQGVRDIREGQRTRDDLAALWEAASAYPDEWLLHDELKELA